MLQRALNKLPITSITPFTFQDYPEHTACILWFSGCNMACSYCHNPELVKGELAKLPAQQVVEFLESRKGLLEGVVLSGGECMMSTQLPEFAGYLKSLGYKIKVDTNGTNPDMLAQMLGAGLIDYVALDFKAPADLFSSITGYDGYASFDRSLALLVASGVGLEVRTTVHADLLDEEDINAIIRRLEDVGFKGAYYLQNFRPGKTLGNIGSPFASFDLSRLSKSSFILSTRNF
ncbi:MAG: anaerobic ribonucleoside-triphosphate reductase activating protein [Alphaproteobacteria bacterium]|nr:anaerobic ribonucleoside-triphosphate reductase activating protein [Alphaproteobacteria bacterium]